MKKATLDELRRMKEAGQLLHDPAAPDGEALGPEFWRGAVKEPSLPATNPLKDEKSSRR